MKIAVFANSDFEEASTLCRQVTVCPRGGESCCRPPSPPAECWSPCLARGADRLLSASEQSPVHGRRTRPRTPVLCECELRSSGGAVAVPRKNFIAAGRDDAAQGKHRTGNQYTLGRVSTVGLRFQKLGRPAPGDDHVRDRSSSRQRRRTSGSATLQIHDGGLSRTPTPFGPPAASTVNDTLPLDRWTMSTGHRARGQTRSGRSRAGEPEPTPDLASSCRPS